MRRDHEDLPEIEDGACDRASEDAGGARHSGAPYRDRRDALVARRRALAREHADAERAAERRDELARHLEVIDAALREELSVGEHRRLAEPGTAARAMRVVAAGMLFGVSAAAGASIAMVPLLGSVRPPVEARSAGVVDAAPRRGPRVTVPRVTVPRVTVPRVRVGALTSADAIEVDDGTAMSAPITVADLDAHIRWIAPQAWEVDRELFERALRSSPLGGAPRLIPDDRGRVRVFGIRRTSLLGRLGFQNGDTLIDVNGYPLAEPDRALEAYARLRASDSIFLRLERHGEERVHVYRIVL